MYPIQIFFQAILLILCRPLTKNARQISLKPLPLSASGVAMEPIKGHRSAWSQFTRGRITIKTTLLGHSLAPLAYSLAPHRSLIRLLRTARFGPTLSASLSLALSLAHFLPSSSERWLLSIKWMRSFHTTSTHCRMRPFHTISTHCAMQKEGERASRLSVSALHLRRHWRSRSLAQYPHSHCTHQAERWVHAWDWHNLGGFMLVIGSVRVVSC